MRHDPITVTDRFFVPLVFWLSFNSIAGLASGRDALPLSEGMNRNLHPFPTFPLRTLVHNCIAWRVELACTAGRTLKCAVAPHRRKPGLDCGLLRMPSEIPISFNAHLTPIGWKRCQSTQHPCPQFNEQDSLLLSVLRNLTNGIDAFQFNIQ